MIASPARYDIATLLADPYPEARILGLGLSSRLIVLARRRPLGRPRRARPSLSTFDISLHHGEPCDLSGKCSLASNLRRVRLRSCRTAPALLWHDGTHRTSETHRLSTRSSQDHPGRFRLVDRYGRLLLTHRRPSSFSSREPPSAPSSPRGRPRPRAHRPAGLDRHHDHSLVRAHHAARSCEPLRFSAGRPPSSNPTSSGPRPFLPTAKSRARWSAAMKISAAPSKPSWWGKRNAWLNTGAAVPKGGRHLARCNVQ